MQDVTQRRRARRAQGKSDTPLAEAASLAAPALPTAAKRPAVQPEDPGRSAAEEAFANLDRLIHARIGRDPQAQVWINHPGEVIHSGYGRPSYWGGSASVPRVQQYRDLALVRARQENIPIVLGSATPSLARAPTSQ